MSNIYSSDSLTGKMVYLKAVEYAGGGRFHTAERAKCIDYNEHTKQGVFMLRGGECVMKYDNEIVSIASDQSPFSLPEPKVPVTARSIVARIKKFFA